MGRIVLFIPVVAALMLIGALRSDVQAELHICIDAAGKKSYTNVITSGNCQPLRSRAGINRRPQVQSHSWTATTLRSRLKGNSSSYDRHINRSARRYNVDPYLIKAVIKTESDFDCYALSKAGAQGLMQLMPGTARELNVRNPFNPYENIDGGTRYLRDMLKIFNGNLQLSLAAYNAGPTLVKRLQRIPRIPETERYIKKVLRHYKGYRGSLPQSQAYLAGSKET
jgi:soluble lytic murein transglycosylase-like protein